MLYTQENGVGIIMEERFPDFDTARLVAFNLFDEMYNSRSEAAQPYWDGRSVAVL